MKNYAERHVEIMNKFLLIYVGYMTLYTKRVGTKSPGGINIETIASIKSMINDQLQSLIVGIHHKYIFNIL